MIAHNVCYSTLCPPPDEGDGRPVHATPMSKWTTRSHHFATVDESPRPLVPIVLRALLSFRRDSKRRARAAAAAGDDALASVLNARQLALKLCANATYGFCGAEMSPLCGPPLAEATLRWGNFYCREAARLIARQWPDRRVVYAATDSVFVAMPADSSADEAVGAGEAMARFVSAELPDALTLEFERVLSPFVL